MVVELCRGIDSVSFNTNTVILNMDIDSILSIDLVNLLWLMLYLYLYFTSLTWSFYYDCDPGNFSNTPDPGEILCTVEISMKTGP